MESKDNRTIEGIYFESEKEYESAYKELETIREIERKFAVGDAKVALSIYNKAVSKKSFKTIIGYMFLKRLRDTIVSCGLVDSESLYPIPVGDKQEKKENVRLAPAEDNKYLLLYRNENKKKKAAIMAVVVLAVVIVIMFFVTAGTKYSFVTYFTDYENDIRNEVIDEYEQWEKELTEREEALSKGYVKE